jgi:hypothetical protein
LLATACNDENDIDTEKPEIDNSFTGSFPANCDTLYFGETFELKLKFSDNFELGSYNISIHDNFDHHSHSTEITECWLDPKKEPVNPFTFIQDFSIPDGTKEFETDEIVEIPDGNESGLYDEGDYHFFISLTDKEGWSDQKGLSIKIIYR